MDESGGERTFLILNSEVFFCFFFYGLTAYSASQIKSKVLTQGGLKEINPFQFTPKLVLTRSELFSLRFYLTFERERWCTGAGDGAEAFLQSSDQRLDPGDHDLRPGQTPNQQNHPGAPRLDC